MGSHVHETDAQTLVRYLRTFASGVFCAVGFTFAYIVFYKLAFQDFSLRLFISLTFDLAMVYSGFSLAWFATDKKYAGVYFGISFAALHATIVSIGFLIALHPKQLQEGEFWILPVFQQGLFVTALLCIFLGMLISTFGVVSEETPGKQIQKQ